MDDSSILAALMPEERALFHTNVLDLSTASDFYKKQAKIASRLEDVIDTGQDRYRLSPRVLRDLTALRGYAVGTAHTKPADRLAHALYLCARSLAYESLFKAQRTKNEEWGAYFDAVRTHGPVRPRAERRLKVLPVRENGEVLESLSHPELQQLVLQFAFNTELASFPLGKDRGVIGIPETIEIDENLSDENSEPVIVERSPQLTIELKGEPVVQLMIASFDKDGPDIDRARKFTLNLLSGLTHELKRFLGLTLRRGRPRLGIGEKAAHGLDYHGRTIIQVTNELCPKRNEPGHRHVKGCRDRIRLAADHYYKSLAREFEKPLLPKAKKT
jgi:hypothetical protein